jgi:hypothetical protein
MFQIALGNGNQSWYNAEGKTQWKDELYIILSLVQIDGTAGVNNSVIKQHINYSDLKELSALLWRAQHAYESRKKEAEERIKGAGEAANETTA